MKLLKEITEKSLSIEPAHEILGETFRLRKSARGILLNDKNEVSLQFVSKHGYYKLPGGGVDEGESTKETLQREIMEEVGCDSEVEHELGITIEYRNKFDLLHISYGYITKVKGKIGKPSYEQGEIDDGFKPIWATIEDSIKLVKKYKVSDHYSGSFIVERELVFLKEALRILQNK